MNEKENSLDFNLFQPKSDFGKKNSRIIISMIIVWALAVFGFQIALKILEKPTPEIALTNFEKVMPKIADGTATIADKQLYCKSVLSGLGKLAVKADDKKLMSEVLNVEVNSMIPDSLKGAFTEMLSQVNAIKDQLNTVGESDYQTGKEQFKLKQKEVIAFAAPFLNLPLDGVEASILPYYLTSNSPKELTAEIQTQLHDLLRKYMTHNQSFLTDTNFLGFPFHYFYTGEFLLFFFIFWCWLYSYRIDKLNTKFNIIEN